MYAFVNKTYFTFDFDHVTSEIPSASHMVRTFSLLLCDFSFVCEHWSRTTSEWVSIISELHDCSNRSCLGTALMHSGWLNGFLLTSFLPSTYSEVYNLYTYQDGSHKEFDLSVSKDKEWSPLDSLGQSHRSLPEYRLCNRNKANLLSSAWIYTCTCKQA